jgi:hypothetical protein
MSESKICTVCNISKSLNNFHKNKAGMFGVHAKCKECRSEKYKINKPLKTNFYIYKFIDKNKQVIYVGKTDDIHRRINNHFNEGHLVDECYIRTEYIYIQTFTNYIDMNICELYYINKYNAEYNVRDKNVLGIETKIIEKKWEEYSESDKTIKTILDNRFNSIENNIKIKKTIENCKIINKNAIYEGLPVQRHGKCEGYSVQNDPYTVCYNCKFFYRIGY